MRLIGLFAIFFLVYLEISLFVWIVNQTNVLSAILLGLSTTFGGIALVKKQGIKNMLNLQMRILNQENSTYEVFKGFFILFSGALLVLPGFITDLFGLLLLLPLTQKMLYRYYKNKLKVSTFNRGRSNVFTDDNTIDGEFTRHDEHANDRPRIDDKK